MDEPTPASFSMTTSWPLRTSSCTPAGVMATRYSWFLTSRGIPTFTAIKSSRPTGGATGWSSLPTSLSAPGSLGHHGPGKAVRMKLYADRPLRLVNQLLGDVLVVVLVYLCVRL